MIAAVILTLLQMVDAWTTHRILERGGRELNPILARVFARIGHVAGLILAKGAFIAILWFALPTIQALPVPYADALLWSMVAAYVAVAVVNLRALSRQP